ncbi:MAG: hypothetical protein JJU11_11870 [Candidatus Sumerlaeia bacterium]|nr:hypothetical protein [Candidatus Sumerlaeia bacterium]
MPFTDLHDILDMKEHLLDAIRECLPGWHVLASLQPGVQASKEGIRRLPEARLLTGGLRRDGTMAWSLELSVAFQEEELVRAAIKLTDALEAGFALVEAFRRHDGDPLVRGIILDLVTHFPGTAQRPAGIYTQASPAFELDEKVPEGNDEITAFTILEGIDGEEMTGVIANGGAWSPGKMTAGDGVLHLEQPLVRPLESGTVIYTLGDGVELGRGIREKRVVAPEEWSRNLRDLGGNRHQVLLGQWRERVHWHVYPCRKNIQEGVEAFLRERKDRQSFLLVTPHGGLREGSLLRLEAGERDGLVIEWDANHLESFDPFLNQEE